MAINKTSSKCDTENSELKLFSDNFYLKTKMTTSENDCSKTVFDKYFLHPYQEQVDVLDVKFVCMDGETISCDSRILQNLSGFFSDKIQAHRRKEEELIFKYEAYGLDIVQSFLDYCHSIPKTLEKLKLQTKVNLLSFVVYEGKCEWDGVEKTLEQKLTKLIQETILSKDYRSHSNCFCWMRDNLTAMLAEGEVHSSILKLGKKILQIRYSKSVETQTDSKTTKK